MTLNVRRLRLARIPVTPLAWLALAAAAGIGAGLLPVPVALIGAGTLAAVLIGLAQPSALLIVTLVIAPVKVLLDTEQHSNLDPGQLALALTAAAWLAQRIALRRSLLRGSSIYVPIVLVILGAGLSLFVALAPLITLIELSKWVEMLGVAGLVVTLGAERGWGWVAAGLIAAGVAQALIGLYEFFGGSGIASLWILDNQRFRAFGTFGQPNPFGAFMGLLLPVTIGLLVGLSGSRAARARSKSAIMLLILAGLLLFGGLIASWSRGGWLGFAAALFVMFVLAPRRRWLGVALAAGVVLLGGGALVTGVLPASIAARLGDFTSELSGVADVRGQIITDANYAVLERLAHWQAGLAMADAHPWLGVGFGNYEAAYPDYGLMNWHFALGHAHNYFINMLAETGVVGFGAYVAAWLLIFGQSIRLLDRTRGADRGLALGLIGAWTYLAVHSLFDKLYVDNLFLHIGAMLGLIGALTFLSRDTARHALHDSI